MFNIESYRGMYKMHDFQTVVGTEVCHLQLKEASFVKMGNINKFIQIIWKLIHYY